MGNWQLATDKLPSLPSSGVTCTNARNVTNSVASSPLLRFLFLFLFSFLLFVSLHSERRQQYRPPRQLTEQQILASSRPFPRIHSSCELYQTAFSRWLQTLPFSNKQTKPCSNKRQATIYLLLFFDLPFVSPTSYYTLLFANMTKIKLVRSGRECDADEQYYKCSYFDFEFRGCCSHDPCIKPRGCRDHDSVFVDTSLLASFSTIDMSDTETATSDTITSESTATESAAGSTTADRFGRETTFLTRTRPKAITTMDEDNEETSLTLKRTAHPKTMTDSGTTRTIPNSSRVTVTHITMIPTSKLPTTSREAPLTFVTSSFTDGLPYPTASFESTPTGIPTQTSTVGPSLNDDSSGTPPIGIIVGGVVGGVVVLALVILAVFMVRRRRHNRELWVNGAGEYTFDEKEEKSYLRRMLSRNTTQRSQDPFAPFGGMLPGTLSDSSSDVVESFPKRMLKRYRAYRQSRRPPPATQWYF